MERLVYQELARSFVAMENCKKTKNDEWYDKHGEKIEYIIENYLPHGSGIDGKTEIVLLKCNENKLVFNSEYHCMNQNGYYDGWVNFTIKVMADLSFGYKLSITGSFGKYSHDVKDYLHDLYYYHLSQTFNNEKYNQSDNITDCIIDCLTNK